MAHPDDCQTCRTLDESNVVVKVEETEDPTVRRFVVQPWPIVDEQHFDRNQAMAHPLARALWRNGTTAVVLDARGALVRREDPRAWAFYAEGMAVSLREQLALHGA